MFQSILANDRAFVDFYANPSGSAKKLVFTFSPLDRIGAERNARGFAVQFLLKNGYDVVAFTTGRALWYQDFSKEALETVADFVASLGPRYDLRVGYGMSMGATAAIAFSRLLMLDRVIGFSPQFTVNAPWDPRWAPLAEPGLEFSILPDQISDRAEFFIVYDAFDAGDALQVDEFRTVISSDRLHLLNIDHTGHMTGFCLQQARVLRPLVLSVLDEGVFPDTRASFRASRRKSAMYIVHLAGRLAARRRLRCAIAALDEALGIYLREEPGAANWASDCVGVYLDKSKYLAELGRIDDAQTCCELAVARARAHEPERLPFALNQRASYFSAAGDFEAALRAQDEAVELRPDFAAFHGYRAASLLALGRREEAIAAARRQVALAAADAGAHYSLSHVLSACGRHAEALESLRHAVRLDADNATYLGALAHLLGFLGHPDEAAATLRAIIAKGPADVASRANLSRALYQSGRFDEALAAIDEVIAKQPRVAAHHAHRSVVCYHLGRHGEAVRSARDALACEPGAAQHQAALDHMLRATGLGVT